MFSRPVRSGGSRRPARAVRPACPRTATSLVGGPEDAADALEQRRLARPVAAEDRSSRPRHRERHVASAQKSSVDFRRPPWMMRSLTVLYWPWATRNRLETSRTSTAKSLTDQSSSAKLPSSRPNTARATRNRTAEAARTRGPHVPQHAVRGQRTPVHPTLPRHRCSAGRSGSAAPSGSGSRSRSGLSARLLVSICCW